MDPFTQVLKDTQDQIAHITQYLDNRSNQNVEEIQELLNEIEETTVDLDNSVLVMKRDNMMTHDEIHTREMLVQDVKTCINTIKKRLSTPKSVKFGGYTHEAEEEMGGSQLSIQDQLLQEQDVHLDSIHKTMQNLHMQASTMGQELEDQSYLIEDVDSNIDTVMSKLERGRKQLEWIYNKNSEKYNDCCIILLIIILVVLLILAFVA